MAQVQLSPICAARAVEEHGPASSPPPWAQPLQCKSPVSVGWYGGSTGMPMDFSAMTRSLGSGLHSAISSSSTPPGSSSGDGGSSGGGGGGW